MSNPNDIDVRPFLNSRYPPKECVLLEEVSNASGYGRSRSADFIVMNLWPSRGLHLTGIELKRSRPDWLREFKDPAKAEDIAGYCDHFYLLTTSDTMAQMHEIPANWGWMAIVKNKLVTMKEAPKLQPKVLDRSFLACLIRRAAEKTGWVRREDIEVTLDIAKQEGRDESKRIVADAQKNLETLREQVRQFEEAAGFKIARRWDHKPEEVGRAIKWYLEGGLDRMAKEVAEVADAISKMDQAAKLILTDSTIKKPDA